MILNPIEREELIRFIDRLSPRERYTLHELATRGADGTLLACFDGLNSVPAINVICVSALLVGLDVWSTSHGEPAFAYLRVRIRKHINSLKREADNDTL